MYLPVSAAHTGAIVAYRDKEILGNEPEIPIRLYDLDMSEPLAIRAHFILTLHDQDTTLAKHTERLRSRVPTAS